jgi:hypothetical protein
MSRLIGPEAQLPRLLRAARSSSPSPSPSPSPSSSSSPDTEHPRLNLAIALSAAVLAAGTVAVCWWLPAERLGWRPVPPAAVAALRTCREPLYNRYNEGGYLIWFVPEVLVFIDSRQDPYPAELLTAHIEAERTGDPTALFARYHIGCAALPPASKVAKRLQQDAGWTTLHADEEWIVFARRGG